MKVKISKVIGVFGLWWVRDKYGFAVGCIEYRATPGAKHPECYVVSLLEYPTFTTRTLEWACGYIHGACRELPDRKEHAQHASKAFHRQPNRGSNHDDNRVASRNDHDYRDHHTQLAQ